jgi:DNA-nicking Smr family endonuclease
MSAKKPSPDAPVTSNPFKQLKALKTEMEAEAARRAAEAAAKREAALARGERVEATKKPAAPVAPPKRSAVEVWRPDLEKELLSVAMAGVTPLATGKSARLSAREESGPTKLPRPTTAEKLRRAHAEGGESLEVSWDPDGTFRAARRGNEFALEALGRYAAPADALDLHGLSEPEAVLRVQEFVRTRRSRGLRCVQIVHGRGRRSPDGESFLRDVVVKTLREAPTSRELDAFASAPEALGGVGAVLVSLRG